MELETWVSTHKNPVAIEKMRAAISDEQNPRYERVRSYISDWKRNDGLATDFSVWFAVADNACARMIGIGLLDLCDANYRDSFEAGERPSSAAREAILSDDLYGAGFFQMGD